MGRWVRWFGEGEAATGVQTGAPRGKRSARVAVAPAEGSSRSGTGVPKSAAPAPTGVISIEQLAAEMLTAVLVREGLLSQADEHIALTEHRATGRAVEAILVETGAVAEADLLATLSRKCKVPLLSLERYRFRPEVLDSVSAPFARANRIIPLERLGKVLNVATSNPLDASAFRRLEEETGFRVKPFLASPREIATCLDRSYPPPPEASLPEPAEEKVPLTTSQLLKESWLGLMGELPEEPEEPARHVEQAPAPEAPGPREIETVVAEKALPLSQDDAAVFARSLPGGVVYRAWADSVGLGVDGPVAALAIADAEYVLKAGSEPLPKRPRRKKAPPSEKSLRTRSGRKKAKKPKKKKSGR